MSSIRDGHRCAGWRSDGGWELWAEPGDFPAHAEALAAYDRAFPPVIDERHYTSYSGVQPIAATRILHTDTDGDGDTDAA